MKEVVKTLYEAFDGKTFDSAKACEVYEKNEQDRILSPGFYVLRVGVFCFRGLRDE